MKQTYEISTKGLDIKKALEISENYSGQIELSADAIAAVERCARYLEEVLAQNERPIYGINTGFGALCNKVISSSELSMLQRNLIRSHASGVGKKVPLYIVRKMLLLKIQSLAFGYSGIQLQTLNYLVRMFNMHVMPRVFEVGSLGASGDLAPLAHLCLPLIGEGFCHYVARYGEDGEGYVGTGGSGITFLAGAELPRLELKPKEGLALLNGTQFMTAYGLQCISELQKLLKWSDAIAALSLEVFNCHSEPFDQALHQIRPHFGQVETAEAIRFWRAGSEVLNSPKDSVQDPYSFRCIPQIHGALRDALRFAMQIIETEINSVSDNPNIFPEEGRILTGGNFHGQSLALALDTLSIGIVNLAGVSERRCYLLLSGARGLPPFLAYKPGIESGLMIAQYTAAALVNNMKHDAAPHSIHSIPSSNGQEDYVSMGANAAVKCYRLVGNLRTVLAIEMIHAFYGARFTGLKTSLRLQRFIKLIEDWAGLSLFFKRDRVLQEEINNAEQFIRNAYNFNRLIKIKEDSQ